MWLRWFAFPVLALAGLGVVSLALGGFVILLAYPNLPSIEALTEYQPKIPLRVYTSDGVLIGEFGEERRSLVLGREDGLFHQGGNLPHADDRAAFFADLPDQDERF